MSARWIELEFVLIAEEGAYCPLFCYCCGGRLRPEERRFGDGICSYCAAQEPGA